MHFKHFCQVLLLVSVCVVSADQYVSVSETDDVEINTQTQNISDVVFHQAAKCSSDADCHHLGKCETTSEGEKSCHCKTGTRGDLCETVDECVDNPVKCGTRKDVSCVFDVVQEKAVCKCDDDSKTYVVDEERCMSPCTRYDQCGQYGNCYHEIGDHKFCACDLGTSGDYCEIIDECHNKDVDCGLELDATCTLGGNGRAYCKCSDPQKSFDYEEKVCKEMCNATNPCENGGTCLGKVCSCLKGTSGPLCKTIDDCRGSFKCGEADCLYNVTSMEAYCKCRNTRLAFDDVTKWCLTCDCGTYQRSCSYVQGNKKCNCVDDYEDRLGQCTLCFCEGLNSMHGCRFDDSGKMICNCFKGYAQIGKECQKCDCGDHGKCSLYRWGYKTCSCDKGYVESGGTCHECNCGPNGGCQIENAKKVCTCSSGFTEHKGTCKACDCGSDSICQFNLFGLKVCTCQSGYAMKDGVCTACACEPGTSCEFGYSVTTDKKCFCPSGYADYRGSCQACDCGVKEASCKMIYTSFKTCICPKGYEEKKMPSLLVVSTCADIDECRQSYICPHSTNCVNTPGSYDCVCKEGYEKLNKGSNYDIKVDGCQDIDECVKEMSPCNDPYARCVNTPGSYRCDCRAGFTTSKGYEEKYNKCQIEYRPWRTSTIVVSCFSIVIIIGLLIGICHRHISLGKC